MIPSPTRFPPNLLLLATILSVSKLPAQSVPSTTQPGAIAPQHLALDQTPPQDTLHVTVGRSLILHVQTRIRRILVGNPAVLQSLTTGPQELVVTAKAAGISSLVLWDEQGRSCVYTVSSDIDPTGLREALKQAYPASLIAVQAIEDRLSLSGIVPTQDVSDGAAKLAAIYSKEVANSLQVIALHNKQVELKLRIVEVDRTKLDLQQKQVLQVLAEPTLTTLSGQVARFLSGGEFPFPVVQSSGGTTVPVVTIQFRSYGVKVEFTPTVNPDGTIRLKVAPEVSALDYTNAVTISGFTIPALSTRRADTEVELKDGQTFMLSGLLDHRTTENLANVPGIGSVPILGQLFRSKNNNHSVVELVVIVTVNTVNPLTDPKPEIPALPKPAVPDLNPDAFDRMLHPAGQPGPQP
jgi:Flp pilus assembly secretin CpaC